LTKSDASDQQICATNLAQLSLGSQPVEDLRAHPVRRENGKLCQELFALDQPMVSSQELVSIRCLEQELETSSEQLDACHEARCHLSPAETA
jgi:hypothetical protein